MLSHKIVSTQTFKRGRCTNFANSYLHGKCNNLFLYTEGLAVQTTLTLDYVGHASFEFSTVLLLQPSKC